MTFEGFMNGIIVLSYIIVAYLGYRLGLVTHTERIDQKLDTLYACADKLKDRNNEFLKNVSETYNYLNGTEGQITELDIFLSDKWID